MHSPFHNLPITDTCINSGNTLYSPPARPIQPKNQYFPQGPEFDWIGVEPIKNINMLSYHVIYEKYYLKVVLDGGLMVGISSLNRQVEDDLEEIACVPLRDLPYDEAKQEIEDYIQKAEDRKVYISELAEELCLDIDLIVDILSDIECSKRI